MKVRRQENGNESKMVQVMTEYTWGGFLEKAIQFAKSLHAVGVEARTCISIMGSNSPTHFISMIGSICADCIISEIYVTSSLETCVNQVLHSRSKVILCDTYSRYKEHFQPKERELL